MALITIGQGGPEVEFKDGTYEMVLDTVEPKIIVPKMGKDAGKDVNVLEWTFADPEDGEVFIKAISSTVFTPKSKTVAWITALLGPDAARIGASFEASDLVGRKALVTIQNDESGWPKVTAVTAMPTRRSARTAPQPVTAAAVATPDDEPLIADAIHEEQDALPF